MSMPPIPASPEDSDHPGAALPHTVDEIEATLTKVLDDFLALQRWSQKPEGSRKTSGIFPVILALDHDLKFLRKTDKAHPLQELAGEVRASFDTKEFRAILLAAFNWRSAAKAATEAARAKRKKPVAKEPTPTKPPKLKPIRKDAGSRKKAAKQWTSRELNYHTDPDVKKFAEDLLAFLKRTPPTSPETYRRLLEPSRVKGEYWHRLPGSYGGNQ